MTASSPRDALVAALTSIELREALKRYAAPPTDPDTPPLAQRFEGFRKRIDAERFILPMTGVQGCGKSTLLNALLFREPVLPIDADETTCVPTEICHDPAPDGIATVEFQDDRIERVPATEEALTAYLHNARNPGNQLGVKRVILASDHPMLADGMVLVDLPGMGSLTSANLQTTREYLKAAIGVIFLLRTVPPLTRSEAVFVASIWSRLPLALFLQNRWSDETASEAEAGRGHNEEKLREIAARNRIPLGEGSTVQVVNAYAAWRAVLMDDPEGQIGSGLAAVSQRLATLGASWPRMVEASVCSALLGELDGALLVLCHREEDLASSADQIRQRIAEEARRFDGYLADLEQRRASATTRNKVFAAESEEATREWASSTRKELRNVMRTKMRAGIVDGPRLTRALRDEEQGPLDEAFGTFQERSMKLVGDIQARFEDVGSWRARPRDTRKTVQLTERLKLEALLPNIVGAGAGIGGVWGGGVAGTKIGAAIGSAGGPPGLVIGGIVGGVVGGFLGVWLGRKARDGVTSVRANAAWPAVKKAIDTFVDGTEADLRRQAGKIVHHLDEGLDAWLQAQQKRYAHEREQRLAVLSASREEREVQKARLHGDDAILRRYRQTLEEGL